MNDEPFTLQPPRVRGKTWKAEDRPSMRQGKLFQADGPRETPACLDESPMALTPTPMMARYQQVKRENPGALLLFRMGDFYEAFYEDAQTVAKVLGLTLTSRDKGAVADAVPMSGFPYHSLESYLQKLIRAGYRVALCEQVRR